MPTYLLSYDLHSEPESVYADLIETLKKGGARRVQQSVWCIDTTWDALRVYGWAVGKLKHGDELVIAEINLQNTVATKNSNSWRAIFRKQIVARAVATVNQRLRLARARIAAVRRK